MKGLAMVQIRCLGGLETRSGASGLNEHTVTDGFFPEIFLIDRWLPSLTGGRAIRVVERFCSRLPSGA
jgi:hypothetical protein